MMITCDEIVEKLCYLAANSRSKHDVLLASANLHKQQRAKIERLQGELQDQEYQLSLQAMEQDRDQLREDLMEAEIVIESALTLLTPRYDGAISAESARQILFEWGEPQETGKEILT